MLIDWFDFYSKKKRKVRISNNKKKHNFEKEKKKKKAAIGDYAMKMSAKKVLSIINENDK